MMMSDYAKTATQFSPKMPCPCHSGRLYIDCCRPLHQGQPAPSAEALMRSRYAAYATGHVSYLMDTTHPDSPHRRPNRKQWRSELAWFCNSTEFAGLTVLHVEQFDSVAYVLFQATLFQNGRDVSFTERSQFYKVNGRWVYHKRLA